MIYFTADTHYWHRNIIRFCQRPFENIYHMNETLINNYNNLIKENDEVYFIGDFALCNTKLATNILERLKGKKFLLRGNHDKILTKNIPIGLSKQIEWVKDYYELEIKKTFFVLFHYAMKTWNRSHYGSIHLYAHSHGKLEEDCSSSLDVGVDAVAKRYAINGIKSKEDYRPLSINEVIKIIQVKKDAARKG